MSSGRFLLRRSAHWADTPITHLIVHYGRTFLRPDRTGPGKPSPVHRKPHILHFPDSRRFPHIGCNLRGQCRSIRFCDAASLQGVQDEESVFRILPPFSPQQGQPVLHQQGHCLRTGKQDRRRKHRKDIPESVHRTKKHETIISLYCIMLV